MEGRYDLLSPQGKMCRTYIYLVHIYFRIMRISDNTHTHTAQIDEPSDRYDRFLYTDPSSLSIKQEGDPTSCWRNPVTALNIYIHTRKEASCPLIHYCQLSDWNKLTYTGLYRLLMQVVHFSAAIDFSGSTLNTTHARRRSILIESRAGSLTLFISCRRRRYT